VKRTRERRRAANETTNIYFRGVARNLYSSFIQPTSEDRDTLPRGFKNRRVSAEILHVLRNFDATVFAEDVTPVRFPVKYRPTYSRLFSEYPIPSTVKRHFSNRVRFAGEAVRYVPQRRAKTIYVRIYIYTH